MSTSPIPGSVRPAKEAVEHAANELHDLVAAQLPTSFPTGGDPWLGYAAAIIVRIRDIVASIQTLTRGQQAIDSGILLRVLYEHVVTFCWIAVDPANNYPRWRSDGLVQNRKLHNDALGYGVTFLDSPQLAAAQAATDQLPDVASMADKVDQHWGGRINGFQSKLPGQGPGGLLTFRGMYIPAYRTLSNAVHGQQDVMDAYINSGARLWPVGPQASDRSLWWPMSVVLYAQALLVCHELLGAPDDARVRVINNAMYGV